MTILITSEENFEKANRGERLFKDYLDVTFPDKGLISRLYFEPFGHKIFPDFLFIHQIFGFFYFEVKNIPIKDIIKVTTDYVEYKYEENLNTNNKKDYILGKLRDKVIETLETINANKAVHKNSILEIEKINNPISGNFALVFTKITRNEAKKSGKFLNLDKIENFIFADEIEEDNIDPELPIKNLSKNKTGLKVSDNLFNCLIRYIYEDEENNLFTINNKNDEFGTSVILDKEKIKEHEVIIKAFDNKQIKNRDKLLEPGLRIINGVAGSGKTLILLKAIEQIVNPIQLEILEKEKPRILVVFYTGTLKRYYNSQLKTYKKDKNIEIMAFWPLIKNKFKIEIKDKSDKGNDEAAELALKNIESSKMAGCYDYIFVDEAQDFYPSWMKLLYQMLKGRSYEDKNLKAVFDGKQDIYGKSKKDPYTIFRLEDGIDLRKGKRTMNLKTSYRTSGNIFRLSTIFMGDNKGDSECFNINGDIPELIHLSNSNEFSNYLNSLIRENGNKIDLNKICVIYPTPYVGHNEIDEIIRNLPLGKAERYSSENTNYSFTTNKINFFSTNYIKGMEYSVVFLFGFDRIPESIEKIDEMFYTSITRAQTQLKIFYFEKTKQIEKLEREILEIAKQSEIN
jgi:hypothetical protein